MGDGGEGQRFVDHRGWWRNRRAVRVEHDALVVERWRGDEVRVPWVDVVGLHWPSADQLTVVTPGDLLEFDRQVRGLEALAQAISDARAAAEAKPTRLDVARWLGGEHKAAVRIAAHARVRLRFRLSAETWQWCIYFVVSLVLLTGRWAGIAWAAVVTVGLLALTFVVTLVGAVSRYTLTVDTSGVTLLTPRLRRRLAWDQIESCTGTPEGGLVLTPKQNVAALRIPAKPAFHKAIEAIWRVMQGLGGVHLDEVPPPPGALSQARLVGHEDAQDRGLSLAEPEESAP
jgi:hypothetical protein